MFRRKYYFFQVFFKRTDGAEVTTLVKNKKPFVTLPMFREAALSLNLMADSIPTNIVWLGRMTEKQLRGN